MASPPILYATVTLVIALVCGLIPIFSKFKEDLDKLKSLTGIAAGIIIASAMLVVIPHGYELASSGEHEEYADDDHNEVSGASNFTNQTIAKEHVDRLLLGGAILGGFLLMLILEGSGIGHAVHEEHHDHDYDHGHVHIHHNRSGWVLVLGLSLHAATDGLAIGASAATSSISVTVTVALAVLIHKGPAAFSLGIFSMHEREQRNDSIRDVVIFSLSTPVMMMLAFYVLKGLETHLIGLVMLFSAGTFLYVATVDTLPDIHNPETGRKTMSYVLFGAILLVIVLLGADVAGLLEYGH